jgi:predicted HicB family RNase H-like nuclease
MMPKKQVYQSSGGKTKRLTVRLPEELHMDISRLAKASGMSVNLLIIEMIENMIKENDEDENIG